MHNKILILDFGSQVTQLIARRVREAGVYSEVHPCDVSDEFIRNYGALGVILSGSHMSAYEEANDKAPAAVFELGVPVLGICYGMQTMALQLGGGVEAGKVRDEPLRECSGATAGQPGESGAQLGRATRRHEELAGGQQCYFFDGPEAALVGRVEDPHRIDLVAEHLDPDGQRRSRREDVDEAAAPGKLAPAGHFGDRVIAER